MANLAYQPAAAGAPIRRYLAANVICLYSEDRPPVIQPPRRGRYPAGVVRLSSVPRLRVGLVCELRTPLNDAVPVRILGFMADGYVEVEAVGPRPIVTNSGSSSRQAGTRPHNLYRTIFRG